MGYNVYRNGVKITSEPVGESEFSDAVAEQGDYCYNVTAIYDRGESSFSNDCLVELGGGDAVTDVERVLSRHSVLKACCALPEPATRSTCLAPTAVSACVLKAPTTIQNACLREYILCAAAKM